MQFLNVDSTMTLAQLRESVGGKNLNDILSLNGIERTPYVGQALADKYAKAIAETSEVDQQRKSTILNRFLSDSDVFEAAALAGEQTWKALSSTGSFPGRVQIPNDIILPDNVDILGNGVPVSKIVYQKVMSSIETGPYDVDPSAFNEYSSTSGLSSRRETQSASSLNFFHTFKIPWGKITLYSSFGDEIQFPVFPETVQDGRVANYSQMPDLLYQYEPWFSYESSGPRTCTYEFHMHRDMWTGDHRDGKCNELIRMCEAQCYAQYQGSAVHTPIVSLYVSGSNLITGILTEAKVSWAGPILLDGWYGEVTLSITITEVSKDVLTYDVIKAKSLIS